MFNDRNQDNFDFHQSNQRNSDLTNIYNSNYAPIFNRNKSYEMVNYELFDDSTTQNMEQVF